MTVTVTSASRGAALLMMGLWLGVSYGILEAVEVMTLGLVPGALSWRNANTAQILWLAPVFYGLLFAMAGGLLALLARALPRVPWDRVLFFVAVVAAVFLASNVHSRLFSPIAALILGAGVAYQLTAWYGRRQPQFEGFMRRSLPWLCAVPLVAGVAVVGGGRGLERLALSGLPDARAGAPNVILLVLDTQRADHLSSYGYSRETTPNLDRLAAEGALFERAYSPSSWTLPSHASMFVGRALHDHQAGLMRRPFLDERFPTLAEQLRLGGYATGGFVANTYWCGRQTGLDRGFIRYEDMFGNAGDAVARTSLGRLLAYDVLPRFRVVDVPGRKYAEEINTDFLDWIGDLGDRPFFAFVNYFDVHGPYLPPAPYAGMFAPLPPPTRTGGIEIGALSDDIVLPPADQIQQMKDRYDESLRYLDDQIGALLGELEARGILDETIVIVTSDHGESWGEHDMLYHGHSLYHEQVHVPLLVRYPRAVTAGQRIPGAVALEWLPATVMALAGIDQQTFRSPTFFTPGGERVLAEVGRRSEQGASWPSSRGWLASVITEGTQYIRHESEPAELYDLSADPDQLHNLAASDTAVAAPLAAWLDDVLRPGSLDPQPFPWSRRGDVTTAANPAPGTPQ